MRPALVSIPLLLLGAAVVFWSRSWDKNTQARTSRATPSSSPAPASTQTPATETNKSIAVLPFVNMSADKDNDYLSDGITEDLCTALTQVRGLRVPARTSSFVFKGKTDDIQKIGQQLRVAHLLEGSVSQSGRNSASTCTDQRG
jgi:TolB-like protein